MERKSYPSDINDIEWLILEPLIPPEKPGGRHREVNIRQIVNAIFYIVRGAIVGGCCPTTCPLGQRSMATFALGAMMGPGNG